MRRVELSPRLQTVAGLVPEGGGFVDVGTDHAYLPTYLIQQGRIPAAVASDLRKGPLERAMDTARRYGVADRMSFRLCDGLAGIAPEEAGTVAIAGMGGETIAAILAAAPWVRTPPRRLILQPMSGLPELRGWLEAHGFCIKAERLCQEGKTLYTVILAAPGAMESLTPAERWAGRQEHGRGDPLRPVLLEHLLLRVERALEGIRRSAKPEDLPRRQELEEVYQGLNEMKKELET
ncbi:SAM-dependent methyltransferase [Pseudoflavonifractor sp. 524-17]|nr:class I SAM-dependent methyltransferase [Pseudoflavonifractor sp. 524-17]NCE65201.1 SAM-dependent methyltransferase [Pseudoflavonifractor sp. 524-17]